MSKSPKTNLRNSDFSVVELVFGFEGKKPTRDCHVGPTICQIVEQMAITAIEGSSSIEWRMSITDEVNT